MIGKIENGNLITKIPKFFEDGDNQYFNPTEAILKEHGWKEVVYDTNNATEKDITKEIYEEYDGKIIVRYVIVGQIPEPTETEVYVDKEREYEARVDELIRAVYTLSQELSILRQKDTKPEQYQEYYDYCEECKERARSEVWLEN